MRDSKENIAQLQKRLNDLQTENRILKNILDKAGLSYHKELSDLKNAETDETYDENQGKRIIHPKDITENMATMFFCRFWGRQDVYAKRSENKATGKAGYYPQCSNFWTDVCHRKIKDGVTCKDCQYRSYKKITKKDVINHLKGSAHNASDVIGVYPLFSDGTCRFMVFDFDNHEKGTENKDFANIDDTWIEEVEAMREICVLNGIDPLIERSRSGRGAHPMDIIRKTYTGIACKKVRLCFVRERRGTGQPEIFQVLRQDASGARLFARGGSWQSDCATASGTSTEKRKQRLC